MAQQYRTTPLPSSELPRGIPYIIGNEAAERFSFYGMKTILAVFMTKFLIDSSGQPDFMSDEEAKKWIHIFMGAVYATPLLGALLSDWLLGKYRTIIGLSLVYCVGHGVLALIDSPVARDVAPRSLLMCGLALIALGSGGIKPCVSAHVGDQFGVQNQHLLPKVYSWFYFSINLGSAFSTMLTPIVLREWGAGWAFGIPGVLMAVATLVFWLGRNKYVHAPPAGRAFLRDTLSRDSLRAILNLMPLYLAVAMFWSLFDQTASAWVLQAEKMDRVVFDFYAIGRQLRWEALPDQLQAANPILVMIFIPLFSYGIYPWLGRYMDLTPLRKISMGLFITVFAFAIPAWIEHRITDGQTPHFVWQIAAYVVLTMAEVMVSITALEFSYTQAPKKLKSFLMAIYMLSVSIGNLFTALVNWFIANADGTSKLAGASYFWFFTAAMLLTACAFLAFIPYYRGRTVIQGDDLPPSAV